MSVFQALLAQGSSPAAAPTALATYTAKGKGGGYGKDYYGGGKGKFGFSDSWSAKGKGKFDGGWGGGWGWDDGFSGKSKGKGKDGKGQGKAAQRIAWGETPCAGTLRNFFAEKNCGYIVSEQAFMMAGGDVYAFRKVLEDAGAGVGDVLVFFLHWSARGQAQASLPMLRLSAAGENNFALKGTFKATEKGFGFVECPQTREFFGRDVYVHKSLAEGYMTGQTVMFNAKVTPDFQATVTAISPTDDAWVPTPGDLSVTAEVDATAGADVAWGLKRKKPAVATGEIMTGTVKAFNERTNFGFIECEEAKTKYNADVFVHGKSLTEDQRAIGTLVTFDVSLNEKGQPSASNVVSAGGADAVIATAGEPAMKKPRGSLQAAGVGAVAAGGASLGPLA